MGWGYYLHSNQEENTVSCRFCRYFFSKSGRLGHGYSDERPIGNSTFNQAHGKEHPEPGLIVHTDQGAQFTSGNFQMLLKARKAIHSESRKGNPYNNALMESFYRTLKRELIQDSHFETPEQAQKEIFKYIELYYNTKRMHSSLGYVSPSEFEKLNS